MRHVPRVFIAAPLAPRTEVTLGEADAHHLGKVLRCRAGDPVIVFNGKGGEYQGAITETGKREITVAIQSFIDRDAESPVSLDVGMAILKRDAMAGALHRLVELGATRITPLITDNVTVSHRQFRSAFDGWQKTCRHAAEQSGRTRLATLCPPQPFDDYLAATEADIRLIAHTEGERFTEVGDKDVVPTGVSMLTGPEGGWAIDEVTRAVNAAYHAVRLGPRILRGETAPAALAAIIQLRWGDFGDSGR